MNIRRATLDDLPALYEIGRGSMDEQTHLAPWDEADGQSWMKNELLGGRVILALDGDSIAGTVGFHLDTFEWNRAFPFIMVTWFYVLPEFRRTRAAWHLADTLKIAAKQYPVLFPITWGGNVAAKTRFFRRLGFRQIGASFMIED